MFNERKVMTVLEALKNLKKLKKAGKGDLELIFEDCRSGDSGSVDIYDSTSTVDRSQHHAGYLCVLDEGTEFVSVYCDH